MPNFIFAMFISFFTNKKINNFQKSIYLWYTYANYGTEKRERGSRILDNYLIEQNTKGFDENAKRKEFEAMLKFVEKLFPFGFKRAANSSFTPRVRFEAISVGVHQALEKNSSANPVSMDWLESKEFEEVTTSDSSNNAGRLTKRVNFVRDCLLNKIKPETLHYEEN